jgi:hypothetical protein
MTSTLKTPETPDTAARSTAGAIPPATPTTPNTVLADLVDAIATYPKTFLTLDIFDVSAPGGGINEFDDVTFKVRVKNSGPLDVVNLVLLVTAGPGAEGVKLHGQTTVNPSLRTAAIATVAAHQPNFWVDTVEDHFHFTAGSHGPGDPELVRVSIDTWDANLNHPLIAHSDPDPSDFAAYSHHILQG